MKVIGIDFYYVNCSHITQHFYMILNVHYSSFYLEWMQSSPPGHLTFPDSKNENRKNFRENLEEWPQHATFGHVITQAR